MRLSYTQIRNAGLGVLLVLIFFEGVFSYMMLTTHSERINDIVSRDESQLKQWYAVSEIIDETKDRFYDFQLGNSQSLAAVDLLLRRVLKDVVSLKARSIDSSEIADIDELLLSAEKFSDMLSSYRKEALKGERESGNLVEMADRTTQMANRMALLGRSAVVYINERIIAKHNDLQALTGFSKRLLILGLLFSTGVTMTVAFIAAKALAAPISQLVEGTQKLAAGNLDHQVDIQMKDEFGKLASSFNAMADQLQRSRNELLAAKKYTDNILKSMLNSLVVVDGAGKIITVNEATCGSLGYEENDLPGRHLSLLFADGYFEKIGFEALLESGGGQQETAFQTKDGRVVPMLISSSALIDADGEVNGLVCVGQDITVQAETMRAGHLASLGELAAGVAHEINNPLNSIINFAQLLLDEAHTEGQPTSSELLERIIKEGDRVSLIVSSLLSFARDESEKQHVSLRLEDIVEETLTLTEMQLRKDGILLDYKVIGQLPEISGHFQQLQQVVLNVLNNSRYALNQKFPGHHPGKRLCLTLQEMTVDARRWAAFECVDFGTGIPEEVLKKVKNPFFSTKPAGSGTGLGLTISHGIVTDHGGKLTLESEIGEYTRVTLLLPVDQSGK
jgi:PAS domain S-box-containing protein